jgi:mevalonate kinase
MQATMQQIIQLYEQIEKLAVAQVELVKSKQLMEEITAPLQELIDQRQECIDKIDKLLGSLSPEQKTAIEQGKTDDAIKRILSLDSESQRMLKEIIEATGSKLVKVQDMKKANRAYGGQDEPTEAWFFDRKR